MGGGVRMSAGPRSCATTRTDPKLPVRPMGEVMRTRRLLVGAGRVTGLQDDGGGLHQRDEPEPGISHGDQAYSVSGSRSSTK